MLTAIADILGLELLSAVALLTVERERAGIVEDGRPTIRFEVNAFFERWGRDNPEAFGRHYRMNAAHPGKGTHTGPQLTMGGAMSMRRTRASGKRSGWPLRWIQPRRARRPAWASGHLGFNYGLVGYDSAAQMFDAFSSSERYQVLLSSTSSPARMPGPAS